MDRQKLVLAIGFGVFADATILSLIYTAYYTFYQTYVYTAYILLALLAALVAAEVFALFPNRISNGTENGKIRVFPSYFKAAAAFNIAALVALAAFSVTVATYPKLQYPAYFPYLFTAFMMTFLVSSTLLVYVSGRGLSSQPRKATA